MNFRKGLVMKFSRHKFLKNARPSVVKRIGKYVEVIDGMKVDFSKDKNNGEIIVENPIIGDVCIYPIEREWCEEC